MSQEEDELKSRMSGIIKDPVMAAKMVNAVVPSKRPAGWGRRSNAPYFKEHYGIEMRDTLDTVLDKKQDVVYDYKTFEALGMSRATVYLRVNQSIHYVCEYLDPEGKYRDAWDNKIQITKERGVGVRISLLAHCREGYQSAFTPRAVVPAAEMPKWRREMEKFLEGAEPGDKFFKDGLALPPEEVKELNDSFIGVDGFLVNITSFSIKIVRIDESKL